MAHALAPPSFVLLFDIQIKVEREPVFTGKERYETWLEVDPPLPGPKDKHAFEYPARVFCSFSVLLWVHHHLNTG